MTERLLNDQLVGQLKEVFTDLVNPVHVLYFGSREDCEYCPEIEQLLTEVVGVSELLSMETRDLEEHAELAETYRVDKAPGFVLLGKVGQNAQQNAGHTDENPAYEDYGVRFSGIPSGHEFSSLINDLVLVSRRDSGLNGQTREFLAKLEKPVHLQVFVTPT